MNPNSMHICCNIDDSYAQHCGVMLTSLFNHSNGANYDIHILISKLNETNRNNLNEIVSKNQSVCHFHEIKSDELKNFKYSDGRRKLTEATYYRLFIASILDESISKVLYLDSDMIIQRDLSPLFGINLSGYGLAATKDLVTMTDEYRIELSLPHGTSYFNAGMLLINLDYWRENGSEKELIAFAEKERRINNHDQDALNAVFRERWFRLSPAWNRFYPYNYANTFFENGRDREDFKKNPATIHFFDFFKPWNKIIWIGMSWRKYRKQYYKYLKVTPWGNFVPQKLSLDQYQKFGLYKYMLTYGFNSLSLSFWDFVKNTFHSINKMLFMPVLVALKIYNQIMFFNQHKSR